MAAIIYAFITGLSFLFGKIGLGVADPIDLLAYRFSASFIAIMIPVIFKLVKLDYNKEKTLKILPLKNFQFIIAILYLGVLSSLQGLYF